MSYVYVIGSLRNPEVPLVGQALRQAGIDAFDDWFAGGEQADDSWQAYEEARGSSYVEALQSPAAQNVFQFDRRNLEAAAAAVLVGPAGKSAHLELGWMLGRGKPGFVYLAEEPARWDVMLAFATGVYTDLDALIHRLEYLR